MVGTGRMLVGQRKALSWVDDGHAEAGQPIEVAPVEREEFIGPAGSSTHENVGVVGELADPAALFKAIHQLPGFLFAEADQSALATESALKQFACRLVGQSVRTGQARHDRPGLEQGWNRYEYRRGGCDCGFDGRCSRSMMLMPGQQPSDDDVGVEGAGHGFESTPH